MVYCTANFTPGFSFTKSIDRKRSFPGGKIIQDGTPFEFIKESPFTADRDSYPIMTDNLT